jgi:hypothetical protein
MTPPSKVYDYDPRNLPQEVLAAIGLAIACSSQTESILSMAIGGCLGLDAEYALTITTHMPLPLKFSVLRSAAEIRIDDLDALDDLDRLLDSIDKALGRRHELAHTSWCQDPDTSQLFRIRKIARTRVETELILVTPETIRNDADTIYQAGMELYSFLLDRDLLPRELTGFRPRGHKSKAARKKRRKV